MKVLVLNYNDSFGGAAVAACNLTSSLNAHGIYAVLGVVEKQSAKDFVIKAPQKNDKLTLCQKVCKKLSNYGKKLISPLSDRIKRKSFSTTNRILHSTNLKSVIDVNWINNSDFDIVNLHWVNRDMISIKDISKIKKPIVWTMHDTWPFCGAEHYPNVLEGDSRFKSGYLTSNKPSSTKGKDLCRIVWNEKKKYLSDKEMVFISPSNYEKDCINSSALFSQKKCFVVPNIIDKNVFFKKNVDLLKELYNIPCGKKIIGFGASYGIDDPKSVKGSFYLVNALKNLENPDEYFLVVFGKASESFFKNLDIPYFASGEISNTKILSSIYNLCDVFVCPSIIENLPYTCLESVFCQVPVAAFNVGGNCDIVKHKYNGYLANPYDVDELVKGIEYCISNRDYLSANCSEKIKEFDEEKTIKMYIDVYNYALNSNKKGI